MVYIDITRMEQDNKSVQSQSEFRKKMKKENK